MPYVTTDILLVDIGLPGLGLSAGMAGDPYLVGSALGADISCLGWGFQHWWWDGFWALVISIGHLYGIEVFGIMWITPS